MGPERKLYQKVKKTFTDFSLLVCAVSESAAWVWEGIKDTLSHKVNLLALK